MVKEHSQVVKEHFELKYYNYDTLIRKLIPKYEEMHELVINSIPFEKDKKITILDLGVGTGQTALHILKKYPNATIDGIDISPKMIEQGKLRLEKYKEKIKFYESDIYHYEFTKQYDAIIAVLCIHHLNPSQKQDFFKKIHSILKPDGIFIIADIIKFDSQDETKQKEDEWKHFLVENLSEKEAQYWFDNYLEEDLPDSVPDQIKWLRQAGFTQSQCIWQHINYAIIKAKNESH